MNRDSHSISIQPRGDSPKDRLYSMPSYALSTAELLSIIIGPGKGMCSEINMAEKVLAACNYRLSNLCKCSINDLMRTAGISRGKASILVAHAELSRRRQAEEAVSSPSINRSTDAANYLIPRFRDLQVVTYGILFLDTNGHVIGFETPFTGGITSASPDVRLILHSALLNKAAGIILCHNQVSQSVKPDASDCLFTKKIEAAAKLMDIKLFDHLIISENGYYSFADAGIIPQN